MASKKDLVEAHAFNRRRLVTAFLSGAPGGREVEPVRYGRTLVGGFVLALLVVVGAAVAPLLRPTIPDDWYTTDGLVIGKSSGARFLAYDGSLYPLLNTTSARLVLGGPGEVQTIPDDLIAERPINPTIGISGGPEFLPDDSALVNSGWTACTGPALGVTVRVAQREGAVAVEESALLVSAGEGDGAVVRVVAAGYQFALPADAAGAAVLRSLGLAGDEPLAVPAAWLDLLPAGEDLTPFAVPGSGGPAESSVGRLDTVGMAVLVDDVPYVLTQEGLVQISPVAYAVYTATGTGAELAAALGDPRFTQGQVAALQNASPEVDLVPEEWPQALPTAFDRSQDACLLLSTTSGTAGSAELAVPALEEARSTGEGISQVVQPGMGAVVRADDGPTIGAGLVYLIDSTGKAYAVGSPGFTDSVLTSLGFSPDDDVASVYAPWIALFREGPDLTRSAAGQAAGG